MQPTFSALRVEGAFRHPAGGRGVGVLGRRLDPQRSRRRAGAQGRRRRRAGGERRPHRDAVGRRVRARSAGEVSARAVRAGRSTNCRADACLYLVRHAKPAAAWGAGSRSRARSPSVDAQARAGGAAAGASAARRMPVYTSPLRRCRETAGPLCELWRCERTCAAVGGGNSFAAARSRGASRVADRGDARHLGASCTTNAPAGSIDYLRLAAQRCVDALHGAAARLRHLHALHRDQRRGRRGATARGSRVLPARIMRRSRCSRRGSGGLRLVELGREAETRGAGARSYWTPSASHFCRDPNASNRRRHRRARV